MADFPALEVMTPGPHGLAVGHRIPLPLRFVFGRSTDNNLAVPSALYSRRHCEVVFEHERWWVRDLGSSNGTFVAGESINDHELRHGDCFELPRGVCFRLLLREPEDVRDEAMERAIRESPDDERRWSVYADWLQEKGASLGERMLARKPEDDAFWLGPLAGDAARDELGVEWAHGLPKTVRLSSRSEQFTEWSWERRIATMLTLPAFRFVRRLEVDLGSFYRAPISQQWVEQVITAVGAGLPMLASIEFGPASLISLAPERGEGRGEGPSSSGGVTALPDPLPVPGRGKLLVQFRAWRPAQLTIETLHPEVHASRQSLELPLTDADRLALEVTRLFRVGHSRDDDLNLTAPWPIPAFIITFGSDRWRFQTSGGVSHPIKVNGVKVSDTFLRPGDVIEPTAGVRLRFDA